MYASEPISRSPDGLYHISREEWERRTADGKGRRRRYADRHGIRPDLKGKWAAPEGVFTCRPSKKVLLETTGFIIE